MEPSEPIEYVLPLEPSDPALPSLPLLASEVCEPVLPCDPILWELGGGGETGALLFVHAAVHLCRMHASQLNREETEEDDADDVTPTPPQEPQLPP